MGILFQNQNIDMPYIMQTAVIHFWVFLGDRGRLQASLLLGTAITSVPHGDNMHHCLKAVGGTAPGLDPSNIMLPSINSAALELKRT